MSRRNLDPGASGKSSASRFKIFCNTHPQRWRATAQKPSPSRHFAATAAITPEGRAETVKKIVAIADKQ